VDRDPLGFNFSLRGVLVHSGTIEAGHYYSFISDRERGWFEFNDQAITPFNPDLIPGECFGGEFGQDDCEILKSKSAYMLVYERQSRPYPQPPAPTAEAMRIQNMSFLKDRLVHDVDYYNFLDEFEGQHDSPILA
jgi:hypothetical protein